MGTDVVDGVLWAVGGLSTLATVVLSLVPPDVLAGVSVSDKLQHALAYGVIAACFLFAAVWRPGRRWGRFPGAAWVVLAGAAVLGISIELIQHSFHRQGDVRDALADVAGILVAWAAWLAIRRRWA